MTKIMPSAKQEQRENALTFVSPDRELENMTPTSCSDDDDNATEHAELLEQGFTSKSNLKKNFFQLPKRRNRNSFQMQRGVRRLVVCAMLIPMFICLLIYLPIYTNIPNRHVPLHDWPFNASRNVSDYVQPMVDTTLIAPRKMCNDKVFVTIIICSSLHNFVERQTIRETWGNTTEFNYASFSKLHAHMRGHYLEPTKQRLSYYSEFLPEQLENATLVRIVFLLGRSKYEALLGNETISRLHNEAEQYNDIIQENFVDTYNNLTIKSVLALKYLSKHCLHSSAFFMKCDDDTFVNVPNLLHFLLGGTVPLYNETLNFYDKITYQVMSPRNRFNATADVLTGHIFCTALPVNDVTSKWYMPYYMYPGDAYPKYLSGAGYLMSADVVDRLYQTALNTSLIYLEDVYLTGLCAETAQLNRTHNPLFSYNRSKKWCTFKGIITQHELKDDSMVDAWRFVSNYTKICPPPSAYFKQMRLRKRIMC